MSAQIGFDKKHKRFYVKGSNTQKLSGLHRVLQKKFYPPMSTHENIRHYRFAKRSKKQAPLRAQSGRPLPVVASLKQAMSQGKRIDGQIQRLVEAAQGDALLLRSWVSSTPLLIKKTAVKKPKIKMLHPFTCAAIKTLLDHDWVPTQCQVVVGSVPHRIATAADIVCKHRTLKNTKAVVEVKTGYEATWKSHTNQKLNKPLEKLDDSSQNKAHLQAACTALLYKASTNTQPEVLVLNVNRTGAHLEKLRPEISQNMAAVSRVLCSSNQTQ